MITIEKGIPIPEKQSSRTGRSLKYPWDQMVVGDSVKVTGDTSKIAYYRQLANSWARRNKVNAQFVARMRGKTLRVWRTQ